MIPVGGFCAYRYSCKAEYPKNRESYCPKHPSRSCRCFFGSQFGYAI